LTSIFDKVHLDIPRNKILSNSHDFRQNHNFSKNQTDYDDLHIVTNTTILDKLKLQTRDAETNRNHGRIDNQLIVTI